MAALQGPRDSPSVCRVQQVEEQNEEHIQMYFYSEAMVLGFATLESTFRELKL